ncbi:MAG: hypothetical protein P8X79_01255 [Reinekea sp.]
MLIFAMPVAIILCYITKSLLFYLLIITLLLVELYCSRKKQDSFKACVITLQNNGFDFRELESKYQVFINYSRIKSVSLQSHCGQTTVVIDIDEQAQLLCPRLENPQLLVDNLNSALNP